MKKFPAKKRMWMLHQAWFYVFDDSTEDSLSPQVECPMGEHKSVRRQFKYQVLSGATVLSIREI